MAKINSNSASKSVEVVESDILVGMKAICSFLRMSEATVLKWLREYDDFPVKKNGGYISSRIKLNSWFHSYLDAK